MRVFLHRTERNKANFVGLATLHPFDQIPTYDEGALALFETGAIVFDIAERNYGPEAQKAAS